MRRSLRYERAQVSALDEDKVRCPTYGGAYAWVLENLRTVEPFRVRGQPSLFDIDDAVVERHLRDH